MSNEQVRYDNLTRESMNIDTTIALTMSTRSRSQNVMTMMIIPTETHWIAWLSSSSPRYTCKRSVSDVHHHGKCRRKAIVSRDLAVCSSHSCFGFDLLLLA